MTLNKRHKPKIILSVECKNKLVAFFSLLIEIDKRIKKKPKQAKSKETRDIKGPFNKNGPCCFFRNIYLYNIHLFF